MPFDSEKIAATTRHELIVVGRKFGSEDTLAQANKTSNALKIYGPKLVRWGFNGEDTQLLGEARDALLAAGVGREVVRVGKKTTNKAYAAALETGKSRRLQARSVLSGARRALAAQGNDEAVRAVDTVLNHAPTAEESASKLAGQLDTLRAAFSEAPIAQAASQRGGPEIVADLLASSEALRAISQETATAPGTPAETELLDLIDGVIVGLARAARRAARAAAKASGEHAMATAFELTELYRSAKGKKAAEAEEPGAAGDGAKPGST